MGPPEPWSRPRRHHRAFARRLRLGWRASVFAVMDGERPVGMASLVVDDMSDRRELTPWLASVYVLPEWRGRGIASRLVRRVEEEARAHGVERFYLYTPDQQALYRRLGWQDVEQREYRGEMVTIMQRDLPAPV